jgi:thioredoxin 1
MAIMIEVGNQRDLLDQLKGHKRAVALFYASWCPFCMNFQLVFDRYARENDSSEFIRVNVDEDSNPLWEEYCLGAVPTIILFEYGRATKRLDGRFGSGISEKQFRDWLKNL